MRISLVSALFSAAALLVACNRAPEAHPLSSRDFVWSAECSRPVLDPPMFRELTVTEVLRVQGTLDTRLTQITEAQPEGFGATELYFTLVSPASARLLVISSEPLSPHARTALAPLATEAQTLYEQALGIIRP